MAIYMGLIVPDSIKEEIDAYRRSREIPDSPLVRAILRNDLIGSTAYSDDSNHEHLVDIVKYCIATLPLDSWGSIERYANYTREK